MKNDRSLKCRFPENWFDTPVVSPVPISDQRAHNKLLHNLKQNLHFFLILIQNFPGFLVLLVIELEPATKSQVEILNPMKEHPI